VFYFVDREPIRDAASAVRMQTRPRRHAFEEQLVTNGADHAGPEPSSQALQPLLERLTDASRWRPVRARGHHAAALLVPTTLDASRLNRWLGNRRRDVQGNDGRRDPRHGLYAWLSRAAIYRSRRWE
jgi:hypothetical protein